MNAIIPAWMIAQQKEQEKGAGKLESSGDHEEKKETVRSGSRSRSGSRDRSKRESSSSRHKHKHKHKHRHRSRSRDSSSRRRRRRRRSDSRSDNEEEEGGETEWEKLKKQRPSVKLFDMSMEDAERLGVFTGIIRPDASQHSNCFTHNLTGKRSQGDSTAWSPDDQQHSSSSSYSSGGGHSSGMRDNAGELRVPESSVLFMSDQDFAATRNSRRIYVGNLPVGVSREDVGNFFNDLLMQKMRPVPEEGHPRSYVCSIFLKEEKNYAFVEFIRPEIASMLLGVDGLGFHGQPLRIRRPSDWTEMQPNIQRLTFSLDLDASSMPGPSSSSSSSVPGLSSSVFMAGISPNVPEGPKKVFIGGVPHHLREEQIMELLQAFGPLESFHLVRDHASMDPNSYSKGFCFCTFKDDAVTDTAIQGLNGLVIGDRVLNVRRSMGQDGGNSSSSSFPPQHQQGEYPSTYNPSLVGSSAPHLSSGSHYGPSSSSSMMGGSEQSPPNTETATTVLKLENMVTVEEINDDEEYRDILSDIFTECSKFGSLQDVKIPRRKDGHQSEGSVFLKYTSPQDAMNARNALSGKKFNNNTITTAFYDEGRFGQNILG
jgi:splicing factor U2AF subunit